MLHALLTRRTTKGRDLYDLIWCLSDPDWPEPNLVLLNKAMRKTRNAEAVRLNSSSWRAAVRARLARVNWARAAADVRPFLQSPDEALAMVPEALEQLLGA
jgi:hypothetical protein